MPIQIFKLRSVPDDEANEIRSLLHEKEIEFYETNNGNWGISLPAIWVHDKNEAKKAKALIENYQQERQQRAQTEWQAQEERGENPTIWDRFKASPLQFISYIIMIIVVAYITLLPFLPYF